MKDDNAIHYSIILEFINRTQELENTVKRIQQQLQQLQSQSSKATEESEGAVEAVVSSLAFLFAGKTILTRFLLPSIEVASSLEQWRVSLGVFYGDLVKTNKTMEFLMEYARKSPFTLPQIVAAGKQLAAYRLEVEEWLPVLGNLAAAVGRDIVEISYIFGYMAGERWGEFFEAIARIGIPRKEFERFGVVIDTSTGRLKSSAKEVRNALRLITEDYFARMQEILAKTTVGLRSMVEDARTRLQEIFMIGKYNLQVLEETGASMLATYKRFLQLTKSLYELRGLQAFFSGLSIGLGAVFSTILAIFKVVLAIVEALGKLEFLNFFTQATGRVLGMALALGVLIQTFKALRTVWTILFSTKNIEVFSALVSFLTSRNVQLQGIFSQTIQIVKSLLLLDFRGFSEKVRGTFNAISTSVSASATSFKALFATIKAGVATITKFAISFGVLLAVSYVLEWLLSKLWNTIAEIPERSKKYYEALSENLKVLRERIQEYLEYFSKLLDLEIRMGEQRLKIITDIYDQERALTFFREKSAKARFEWEKKRIDILLETGIIEQSIGDLMLAQAQREFLLSVYEEKALRATEARRAKKELTLSVYTNELDLQMKLLEFEKLRYEALGKGYETIVSNLENQIAELEFQKQRAILIDEYVKNLSSVAALDEEVRNLMLNEFRLRLKLLWIDKEITKERERQKQKLQTIYVWTIKQNRLQLEALENLISTRTPITTATQLKVPTFTKDEQELLSRVTSTNTILANVNSTLSQAVNNFTKVYSLENDKIIGVMRDLNETLKLLIKTLREQMEKVKGIEVAPTVSVNLAATEDRLKKISETLKEFKLQQEFQELKKKYELYSQQASKGVAGAEKELNKIALDIKSLEDISQRMINSLGLIKEMQQRIENKTPTPSVFQDLVNYMKKETDLTKASNISKLFPLIYQQYKSYEEASRKIGLTPKETADLFQSFFGNKILKLTSETGDKFESGIKSLENEIIRTNRSIATIQASLHSVNQVYQEGTQNLIRNLMTIKSINLLENISKNIHILSDIIGKTATKDMQLTKQLVDLVSIAPPESIPNLLKLLSKLTDENLKALTSIILTTSKEDRSFAQKLLLGILKLPPQEIPNILKDLLPITRLSKQDLSNLIKKFSQTKPESIVPVLRKELKPKKSEVEILELEKLSMYPHLIEIQTHGNERLLVKFSEIARLLKTSQTNIPVIESSEASINRILIDWSKLEKIAKPQISAKIASLETEQPIINVSKEFSLPLIREKTEKPKEKTAERNIVINLNNYFSITGAVEEKTIENISLEVEKTVREAILRSKYEIS